MTLSRDICIFVTSARHRLLSNRPMAASTDPISSLDRSRQRPSLRIAFDACIGAIGGFRRRLGDTDSVKVYSVEYFDAVVHVLCWGFPGSLQQTWTTRLQHRTRREKCLPHLNQLIKLARSRAMAKVYLTPTLNSVALAFTKPGESCLAIASHQEAIRTTAGSTS